MRERVHAHDLLARPKALAAATLLVAALATGCLSPADRYRVLSFFFDGVPLPGAEQELVVLAAPPEPGETRAAELVAPQPASEQSAHAAYSDKECGECHDKGAANRLIARAEELCWNCHEQEEFAGDVMHGPVGSGQCVSCHNPHRAPRPHLLREAGSALCGGCHDQDTFPGGELHRDREGDDCVSCHNPHAAGREYMLRPETGPS